MTRLTWIGTTANWEPGPRELRPLAAGAEIWIELGLTQADVPGGAHWFSGAPPLGIQPGHRSQVIYASGNPFSEDRQAFWRQLGAAWSAQVILDPFAALALAAETDLWLQPGRSYAVVGGQLKIATRPDQAGPLTGWDVVVTRPLEQAAVAARTLTNLGARALSCPMWRLGAPQDPHALAAWRDGGPWGGVLVTSAQAAQASANAILQVRPAQVAAVGPKTASVLRRGGVKVQLVGSGGAVSLAKQLTRNLQPGAKVAVLRAEGAPPAVLTALASQGFEVAEVATHRLIPAPAKALQPLGQLVRRSERPWALIFDGRAAEILASALDPAERARLQVAVIGPQTALTARECGLQVAAEAGRPSWQELVSCLMEAGGEARCK